MKKVWEFSGSLQSTVFYIIKLRLLKEEIKNDEKERDNLINKRKEEFIQEFIDIWNISSKYTYIIHIDSKEKDCVRNNMENLIMRNVYDK